MDLLRRKLIKTGLFGSASLLFTPPLRAADQKQLNIVHNLDFAPFEFVDQKKAKGIVPDILDLVFKNIADYDLTHDPLPWKRAQTLVANSYADGLVAFKSEDRQKFLYFNKTPILHLTPALFFSANHPDVDALKKITNLDDLKHFDVVDLIGNNWAEEHIAPHTPIKWFPKFDQIFKVILTNRFDVHVAISHEMVTWKLDELGLDRDSLISIKTPELAPQIPMYLGLRKSLPDVHKILDQFDENLVTQQANIEQIKTKYKTA